MTKPKYTVPSLYQVSYQDTQSKEYTCPNVPVKRFSTGYRNIRVKQSVIWLTWSSQALFSLSYASFLFFSSCSFSTAARVFAWAWQVQICKQTKNNEASVKQIIHRFYSCFTESRNRATRLWSLRGVTETALFYFLYAGYQVIAGLIMGCAACLQGSCWSSIQVHFWPSNPHLNNQVNKSHSERVWEGAAGYSTACFYLSFYHVKVAYCKK